MAKLTLPDSMDFTCPDKWPNWIKRFERYCIASKLNKDSGEIQVCTLLYTMGQGSEVLLDSFNLNETESKFFNVVKEKFHAHFTPEPNYIHEHAIFNKCQQKEGESIEQYIRALYDLAGRCQFGESKDNNIRDRLVVRMLDENYHKTCN